MRKAATPILVWLVPLLVASCDGILAGGGTGQVDTYTHGQDSGPGANDHGSSGEEKTWGVRPVGSDDAGATVGSDGLPSAPDAGAPADALVLPDLGPGPQPDLLLPLPDSSSCGDNVCSGAETCSTCPGDCGACLVPQSWADCLARSGASTTVITGTQSLYENSSPPSDWNLDLTQALLDGYPTATTSPVKLGKSNPGARMCIGGGIVVGQQSLNLTWYDMHDTIGGGGYRVTTSPGQWSRIDGIRVHNVEDALKPRGPDGYWELWNAYMTYIRDDCIENDEMAPGSVNDSLFDGCYTGFSEQEQSGCCDADPGEVFVVRRSLMRLEAMPGPYGEDDPSVYGHGKWFKWKAPVPHPVEIYDSIFMTESDPPSSSNWPFPPGTVTVNVTIVWLGPGAWKWPVPPGTTVTTDKTVWDKARQRWLDRHGCTSFNTCTKLLNPDPWP